MNFEHTIDRRRFVQGTGLALAAGAPLVLSACGGDATPPSASADIDEANDLKIVQEGQKVEQGLVSTYQAVVPLLNPAAKPLGEQILAQVKTHVTGLATVIGDLGGKPAAGEPPASAVLGPGAGEADAIDLAIGTEARAFGFYLGGLPDLTIGDLRATWTSLATAAAEHQAVLLGVLHPGEPELQARAALLGAPA